jgi:hypothetical protein
MNIEMPVVYVLHVTREKGIECGHLRVHLIMRGLVT